MGELRCDGSWINTVGQVTKLYESSRGDPRAKIDIPALRGTVDCMRKHVMAISLATSEDLQEWASTEPEDVDAHG